MWPVDYQFLNFCPSRKENVGSSSTTKRRSDEETVHILKSLLEFDTRAALQLQDVSKELSKCETTNSILMSHSKEPCAPRQQERRFLVSAGAPAELLTIREALDRKKAELGNFEKEKQGSAKRKAKKSKESRTNKKRQVL